MTTPVPRPVPPTSATSDPSPPVRTALEVPHRFCGPPGIANGGWISGTLASYLPSAYLPSAGAAAAAAVVRLRAATPVETPLSVEQHRTTAVLRRATDTLVEAAIVSPAEVADDVGPPPPAVPVDLAAAATAAVRFDNGYRHTYPGCFVCGPGRDVGDGLRIFPGGHPDLPAGTVAATWRVDESLADRDGSVPAACVWAALDCASYWAHRARTGEVFAALLAQLAVTVAGEVAIGGDYVVVAQADEAAGRRLWGRTALYHPDGALVGQSRALWIRVAQTQPTGGLSRSGP